MLALCGRVCVPQSPVTPDPTRPPPPLDRSPRCGSSRGRRRRTADDHLIHGHRRRLTWTPANGWPKPGSSAHPICIVLCRHGARAQGEGCSSGTSRARLDEANLRRWARTSASRRLRSRGTPSPLRTIVHLEHSAIVVLRHRDGYQRDRARLHAAHGWVSRRGEFRPPALSEPDVTVSHHPAPVIRLGLRLAGERRVVAGVFRAGDELPCRSWAAAQSFVFPHGPSHQVLVDAIEGAEQLGRVEATRSS